MINWLKKNLAEIKNSRPLTLFGGFLALGHFFTFLFWNKTELLLRSISSDDPNPICWPYFIDCADFRLSLSVLQGMQYVYLLIGLLVAFLFFSGRKLVWGYQLQILLFALSLFFYVQSYRMMGNYLYMFYIILFVYLFIPSKKNVIRLMIVGFYLAASTLKFNKEWISGEALFGHPILKGFLLQVACMYVIFLELVISALLLSAQADLFWIAFVQFLIFHIFSWHIVGFFYPCMMFCLLSSFLLFRGSEIGTIKKQSFSTIAVLLVFVSLQLVPYLYKGDTALTGEGRFWSLNMFDVKAECVFKAFAKYSDRTEDVSWTGEELGTRIQCDPIVFVNYTNNLCKQIRQDQGFKTLDIYLASKRTSDVTYNKIFQRTTDCEKPFDFNLVLENNWIEKDSSSSPKKENEKWSPETVLFSDPNQQVPSYSAATSQYRETFSKTGKSDQDINCLDPKPQWEKSPLNVGVHTASKSSPAVDDSGVYVGSDTGWFFAYDLDGTLRWKFYSGAALRGIHATAALDQESVYIGTYEGIIYSLTKKNGDIRWFRKLGLALGASPTFFEGSLYVSVELSLPYDGFLARIRANDGTILWNSQLYGEQGHASPSINEKDRLVYTAANNGRILALDIESGLLKWESSARMAIKSTPAVAGDLVTATSWDHFIYAFNKSTGDPLWSADLGERSQSSPSFVSESSLVIYGVEKKGFQATNISTGKVVWQLPFSDRNLMTSPLITFNKKLNKSFAWLPCADQTLCSVEASSGRVLSKIKLPSDFTSVPVAFQNSIYLALNSPGGLVKLNCK